MAAPPRAQSKLQAWLRAARLPFYLFPVIAVTGGALAAASQMTAFEVSPWLLACALTMLTEFVAVLTNELHDQKSDRLNVNGGPFTGGSRVLVEGLLTEVELRRGRRFALLAILLLALTVAVSLPSQVAPLLGLLGLGLILAVAYTAPPLRLVYHGLGELTVMVTMGVLPLLAGYVSQMGALSDPLPWQHALPLGLAVMPSIILAGFPDRDADAAAGKGTWAVHLGPRPAGILALLATMAAVGVAVLGEVPLHRDLPWLTGWLVLHGLLLSILLVRQVVAGTTGKINLLMAVSLGYVGWFAAAPVVRFWPPQF